jgi:hypothetical protein
MTGTLAATATATAPVAGATATAPRRPTAWQLVLGASVIAALVNLLVLLIGTLADSSFVVTDAGTAHEVDAGGVVISSVVPVAVGLTVTLLLARWKPFFLRLGQITAGVLALVSVMGPLNTDTDGGTAAALIVMHLVAGAVVVAALGTRRRG